MNTWYQLVFVAFVPVAVCVMGFFEVTRKDYKIDERKESVKEEKFECSEII